MLVVKFRPDIICPECGGDKWWPSIFLKEHEIRWYSTCQNFYIIKEEIK